MRVWSLIILILFMMGCSEIDEPPQASVKDRPDSELYGAKVRFSRVGQPRFTIDAGRIASVEVEKTLYLDDNIIVDFFDIQGRHTAVLTAREGEVMEAQDKLVARGNVVVKSDSGMVLMTEELYFDPQKNRVIADGFVTVISEEDSLTGYGFSAASDLSDWIIRNTSGTTWLQKDDE